MKSLKAQLLIMFKRKAFIITFAVMMLFSVFTFIMNCISCFEELSIHIQAAKYHFILNDIQMFYIPSWIYSLVFPIIPVIPFADSYFEEREKHTAIYCVTKKNNHSYYFSKLLSVFISGAIIIGIPLLINFLLNFIAFPIDSVNTGQNMSVPNCQIYFDDVLNTLLFGSLYCTNMYLYNLFFIFINALIAGLSAVIIYQLSFFYKNSRIILLCMFFVAYHIGCLFASAIFTDEFSLSNYILSANFHNGQSLRGLIITVTAMLLAAIIPIPFAEKRLNDLI